MLKSKISIIIPAYNEERSIKKTLKNILKDFHTHYDYEIVVVCDGCQDNTYKEAKKIAKIYPQIKIHSYKKNQGKGYALTYGVYHSSGNIISFFDAGGDFEVSYIDKFVKLMEVFDADIVIGSKRHPASQVEYPLKRRFYSYIYHLVVRVLFNLNVKDTQTGLKVFRRDVLIKIMPRALVKQYAFDLELLVIAKRLGHKRIFEAPVKMNFNDAKTGINYKSIYYMIMDTLAIFYRAKLLKYYDKAHIRIKKEKKS
ncbi:MAG: glycosyltransferase [Patescibacteria group bacterium]|nr:glycosyltransferase [Patescibacteria group bacterium]